MSRRLQRSVATLLLALALWQLCAVPTRALAATTARAVSAAGLAHLGDDVESAAEYAVITQQSSNLSRQVGQLLDVALTPATLRVNGYDTQQLLLLKNAWPALQACEGQKPGTLKAYHASDPPELPECVMKKLQITKQPTIDVRVVETLNYLTRPTELNNGGGVQWIDVPVISNTYQNDATKHPRDQQPRSDDAATISPLHLGKGFQADQIGQLLGTKFTYQVPIPADQAQAGQLDPSKIDWSKSTIVGKQKLPPIPVNVAWQTPAGAQSARSPDLTGGSMNDLFTGIGVNQTTQYMTERGSTCFKEGGAVDKATIGALLIRSCGGQQLNQTIGGTFDWLSGKDPFERGLNNGKEIFGGKIDVPGRGIDPARLFTAAGAAITERSLNLVENTLVQNTGALTNRDALLAIVGQYYLANQLGGWSGRNEFANLPANDKDATARALGLSFMEARLNRAIDNFAGHTLEEFQQNGHTSVVKLMLGNDVDLIPTLLAINPLLYGDLRSGQLSPDAFLQKVGEDVIATKRAQYPGGIDAAFNLSIGKAEGESPSAQFDRFVSSDPTVWKPIGAGVIASKVNEPSMQDGVREALMTGVVPTDATGLPTIDLGYIDSKFQLQPGDFKAIFMDGQAWSVLSRVGHFQYYQALSGQAQGFADSLKPIYTGQVFVDYANQLKSQAEGLVNQLESRIEQVPDQILGSITSNLQAQLNAMNQGVYDQINARLQAEGNLNSLQTIAGPLQASLSQIASYTQYGPPELRETFAGPLQLAQNAVNQLYVPGGTLLHPSQWTGGVSAGSTVITDRANLEALQAIMNGVTDVSSTNPLGFTGNILALGLERQAGIIGQNAENLVNGAIQALRQAYGTAQALDPANWKITLDKKALDAFILNEMVPAAGVQDFSMAIRAGLKASNGKNLTDEEVRGLITNTSFAAAARLGADQADVAFGLTVGMPFINVMMGKGSADQALANAAYQTALQYRYGITSGFSDDPTINAAAGIVIDEALGWASDSIQDMNTVIQKNGPDGILASLGLLDAPLADRPGQPTLRQLAQSDPEEYTRQAGKVFERVTTNPTPDDVARMSETLDRAGLPADTTINFITGKITGAQFVETFATSTEIGSGLVTRTTDPEALAKSIALKMSNDDETSASYERNLVDAKQLVGKLGIQADGTVDKSKIDEAGAKAIVTNISLNGASDALGSAPDILDVHAKRMESRLIDLGISALDDKIAGMTGVSGVLRTFYKTKDPTEAAVRLGWQALTKFVNMPPELTQVLSYFGGDPISIAKTFSEGRTGAALGALGAAQLYNLTQDAGISIALRDVLVAQLGPSKAEMSILNSVAAAQLDVERKKIDDQVATTPELTTITTGPGEPGNTTGTTQTVDQRKVLSDSLKARLPSQDAAVTALVKKTRDTAMKNMQYATLDYGATMALRAASGNQSVSLSGLTKVMLEGKPKDQTLFLVRTLAVLTPPELTQYIQDAAAAYDIYTFIHESTNKQIEVVDTVTTGPDPNSPGGDISLNRVEVTPTAIKVPSAAFSYVDGRLSQTLGWQVPPGFTKGMVSLVTNGFDTSKSLTLPNGQQLPSMNNVLANGAIAYAGAWLDKLAGLPPGTAYTMYQMGIEISLAMTQVAQARMIQSTINTIQTAAAAGVPVSQAVASAVGSAAAAGAAITMGPSINFTNPNAAGDLSVTTQVRQTTAPGVNGGPPVTTKTITVTTASGPGGPAPSSATMELGKQTGTAAPTTIVSKVNPGDALLKTGTANLAAVTTVAANFVLNAVFGKAFAGLDASIGLPPGTTSTLISAGVAIGIAAAFAAATGVAFTGAMALAALGGPIGIAIMAIGFIVSALGLFGGGKKKKPDVNQTISRIFYSACGVYPGFENDATVADQKITPAQTADAPVIVSPANAKMPLPVINQPVTSPTSQQGGLVVSPTSGAKPLAVTATFAVGSAQSITWGDETPAETIPAAAGSLAHSYAKDGTYAITLQSSTGKVGGASITVGGPPATPQTQVQPVKNSAYPTMTLGALALAPQPAALIVVPTEADPLVVTASFAAGTGLTIQWGDGKEEKVGADVTVLKHTYEKAQSYTVTLQAEAAGKTSLLGTVSVAAGTPPPATPAADSTEVPATPATNPDLFTIADSAAAFTERFRTGDDEGFPFCPAPFETATNVEFAARVGSVAQFNIATFIGKTLYMTKRLGASENPDDNTSIRPKRIQSYDDGAFSLASLIIPRFEAQIDKLYGFQSSTKTLRGTVIRNPATGKSMVDPNVEIYQGIIPNSMSARYVQVSW